MRTLLSTGLLISVTLAVLAACGDGDLLTSVPPPNDDKSPPSASPAARCQGSQGLESSVTLDGNRFRFTVGAPISMTLSVTNCGDDPLHRFYRDSQRYDFIVQEAEDAEVGSEAWRWSANRVFAQVLGEETLGPGETVTYTEVWNQDNNLGQQVASGRYHVLALDVGCEDEALSRCRFGPAVFIDILP